MGKLYHYTNGTKVRDIIDSGFILGTPKKPKPREKQICWLSSHPHWEKTANKIAMSSGGDTKLLTQHETEDMCKGLFRFVIVPDTFPGTIYQWPRLSVEARIPAVIKKRLVSRAKKAGVNPSQWFGVLGDVPVQHTSLESLIGGVWTAVSFDEAQPVDNGMHVISGVTMKRLPTREDEWSEL